MAEAVVRADLDDRDPRPQPFEQRGQAFVLAAVMCDLEHLDWPQRQAQRDLALRVRGQQEHRTFHR